MLSAPTVPHSCLADRVCVVPWGMSLQMVLYSFPLKETHSLTVFEGSLSPPPHYLPFNNCSKEKKKGQLPAACLLMAQESVSLWKPADQRLCHLRRARVSEQEAEQSRCFSTEPETDALSSERNGSVLENKARTPDCAANVWR